MKSRPAPPHAAISHGRHGPHIRLLGLLVFTCLIYALSLKGGFLSYDDDWMVENNAIYQSLSTSDLWTIWCDFSPSTRLLLGAEYLPVRDSSVLLDVYLFGMSPGWMRTINLLLYLVASGFCVLSWRRLLGTSLRSDFIAAFFVLHPVHAESVAWIVGRKDVLGLAFFWLAVWFHQRRGKNSGQPARAAVVCILLLLAQLSKFIFIAAPLLIVVLDYCGGKLNLTRKTVFKYCSYGFVSLAAALLQLQVARTTTMAGNHDVDQAARLLTMGPVWWGYFKSALFGIDLNIMHDVIPMRTITAEVGLGYGVLMLGSLAAVYAALGRRRLFASGWLCFLLPLLPVSQLFVPIQNFHEDRYLVLSVLGPGLIFSDLFRTKFAVDSRRYLNVLAYGVLTFFGMHSAYRAWLFASPIRLFEHATNHSSYSSAAPFQLGTIYEQQNHLPEALKAYHQALIRPDAQSDATRRATNNIARLYVRLENYAQAEHYLRRGRAAFPTDPKILGNLAEVLWLSGRKVESRALYEDLVRSFPNYQHGRAMYLRHFGREGN